MTIKIFRFDYFFLHFISNMLFLPWNIPEIFIINYTGCIQIIWKIKYLLCGVLQQSKRVQFFIILGKLKMFTFLTNIRLGSPSSSNVSLQIFFLSDWEHIHVIETGNYSYSWFKFRNGLSKRKSVNLIFNNSLQKYWCKTTGDHGGHG